MSASDCPCITVCLCFCVSVCRQLINVGLQSVRQPFCFHGFRLCLSLLLSPVNLSVCLSVRDIEGQRRNSIKFLLWLGGDFTLLCLTVLNGRLVLSALVSINKPESWTKNSEKEESERDKIFWLLCNISFLFTFILISYLDKITFFIFTILPYLLDNYLGLWHDDSKISVVNYKQFFSLRWLAVDQFGNCYSSSSSSSSSSFVDEFIFFVVFFVVFSSVCRFRQKRIECPETEERTRENYIIMRWCHIGIVTSSNLRIWKRQSQRVK